MSARPQPRSAGRRRASWRKARPFQAARGRRTVKRRSWAPFFMLIVGLAALVWRFWPHPSLQKMHYPLLYSAVIESEARRAGINPSLVAAVILHESEFRRQASSPVGARGLMQLMPDTAQWVDQHLAGNKQRSLDLFAPTTNVRLGATYLAYLCERFRGDEVALLSAYNAGPETTAQWIAQTRDGYLRIPDIGYAETREYVKSVLHSEEMYRELYPELNAVL